MPNYGRYLRQTAVVLFLLIPFTTSAGTPFTGTFLSDNRPVLMAYASLTQAENQVSGYLVIVTASKRGKTDSVTLNLQGIADQNTVTLKADRMLNDLYLTGYKERDQLRLSIPSSSGSIDTIHLTPAMEDEYTEKLSAWKQKHADTYKEQSQIQNLSTDIERMVGDIQSSKIPEQLEIAHDLLTSLRENVSVIEGRRERFKELSMRDEANQCDYLHSTLSPYFHEELSGYFHGNIFNVSSSLRHTLEDTKRRVGNGRETLKEVKLKVAELRDVLANRKYPLPSDLPELPTNGQVLIDDYESLTDTAEKDIGLIEAEYSRIIDKVRQVMRSSERELNQSGTSCN